MNRQATKNPNYTNNYGSANYYRFQLPNRLYITYRISLEPCSLSIYTHPGLYLFVHSLGKFYERRESQNIHIYIINMHRPIYVVQMRGSQGRALFLSYGLFSFPYDAMWAFRDKLRAWRIFFFFVPYGVEHFFCDSNTFFVLFHSKI